MTDNNLIRFSAALGVLLATIAIGCGGGSEEGSGVKVGVVLSITGPAGALGSPADMAVEAFEALLTFPWVQ